MSSEARKDSEILSKPRLKRKKVYIKPAFRFERVFEVQALACSKKTGHSGCQPTKKVS